jgi:hypothetical protein
MTYLEVLYEDKQRWEELYLRGMSYRSCKICELFETCFDGCPLYQEGYSCADKEALVYLWLRATTSKSRAWYAANMLAWVCELIELEEEYLNECEKEDQEDQED